MNRPDSKFHHGDEVMVFTPGGGYEARGRVVGVHVSTPTRYDVMPRGQVSLRHAKLGVPESQVAALTAPYLAYERRPEAGPRHVRDEA